MKKISKKALSARAKKAWKTRKANAKKANDLPDLAAVEALLAALLENGAIAGWRANKPAKSASARAKKAWRTRRANAA